MNEDETRGSGKISPRHYKGDVITQVWLDSRMLATLSVYLDTEGVMTRFLSEVVREILEMVVANLVRDDRVKMIEDTDDARNMLQTRYRLNLNPRNRKGDLIGGKNLAHNQILSGRKVESNSHSGHNGYSFTDEHLKGKENLPVQPKDDELTESSESSTGGISFDEGVKMINAGVHEDVVKNAREEVKNVLANAKKGEDIGNGEFVIEPNPPSYDNPAGPVGEEFMEKFEKEKRIRGEEEKKKRKKAKGVKKRNKEREKLTKRLEELGEDEDEEIEDDNCTVRKRSDGEIEAERVEKDKKQMELLKGLNEIPTDGIEEE